MDFDFTDDQESLRDAVRRWVDKGFGFERRHALAKAGGATREVYAELAELGLTGLAVPEAHGGMGFGAVEAMVVMEELGRGLVNAPYAAGRAGGAGAAGRRARGAAGRLAAEDRRRRGAGGAGACRSAPRATGCNHVGHARRRSRRRPGRSAAPRAWCRPATRPTPSSCRRASRGADDDAAGIGLFLVDARAPASACAATRRRTAPRAAELVLADTPATLITARRPGARSSTRSTSASPRSAPKRVGADGPAGGHHRRVHEHAQAVRRARIASFQALRHRIADVKMQLELGRSMSYFASLKLGEPAPQRRRALCAGQGAARPVACASSASSASRCTAASACTDEYIASHYFKRLTMLEMSLRRHAAPPGRGQRRACRTPPASLPDRRPSRRAGCAAATMPCACSRRHHRRRRPARSATSPTPRRPTGCTRGALPAAGAVCGVDVRGAAPGTRETDLLRPRQPGRAGARRAADRRQRLRAGCRRRRDALAGGARPSAVPVRARRAVPHRAGGGAVRPVGRRRRASAPMPTAGYAACEAAQRASRRRKAASAPAPAPRWASCSASSAR